MTLLFGVDLDLLKLPLFAIIAATAAITALAKARGADPVFWSAVTLIGAPFFSVLVLFLVEYFGEYPTIVNPESTFYLIISAGAWFAFVALYVRFWVGRRRASPHAMWSCPNSRYLNQPYALICEACNQPFQESFRTF
jgi:hypothetical protein